LGLSDDPEPMWFMAEAGIWLHNAGEFEKAGCLFGALATLSPEEPLGWIGLAKVALDRSDAREGHRYATAAIRCVRHTNATRSESHFVLGRSLALQGKLRDAGLAFARAASADPDGPYGQLAAKAQNSLQPFLAPSDNRV
jgi:tetratricopeptide (TPR) repeat protein